MKLEKIVTWLVVLGMVVFIGFYSLRFVPSLVIREVVVDNVLPSSVAQSISLVKGKPLYGSAKMEVENALEGEPLVVEYKVKQKVPHSLEIQTTLLKADAILVVEDESVEKSFHVLSSGKLFPLEKEDENLYPESVFRILISPSYEKFLTLYGSDGKLETVLRYLDSLQGNISLITMVKYDNNSSNSLGWVVLRLSSLHTEICVREEIPPSLMRKAFGLVVKQEEERLHLTSEWTHYDVYASGMVRR